MTDILFWIVPFWPNPRSLCRPPSPMSVNLLLPLILKVYFPVLLPNVCVTIVLFLACQGPFLPLYVQSWWILRQPPKSWVQPSQWITVIAFAMNLRLLDPEQLAWPRPKLTTFAWHKIHSPKSKMTVFVVIYLLAWPSVLMVLSGSYGQSEYLSRCQTSSFKN